MTQTHKSRTPYFIGLFCVGAIVSLNHLPSAGGPPKSDAAAISSGRTPQQEAALEAAIRAERSKKREQPNFIQDPKGADKYVTTLAQRHGSNFDRLSDDDKSLLNGMSGGHGEDMLRGRVAQLRQAKIAAAPVTPVTKGVKPRKSGKGGTVTNSRLSL